MNIRSTVIHKLGSICDTHVVTVCGRFYKKLPIKEGLPKCLACERYGPVLPERLYREGGSVKSRPATNEEIGGSFA